MGTIPARVGSARLGSARLTCDYNAISVQLQLQLPTGTELGNIKMVQKHSGLPGSFCQAESQLQLSWTELALIAKLSSSRQLQLQLN